MTFIDQLNALATRIPRNAFRAYGALDHLTYVLTQDGSVVYVGEGKPARATKQFVQRGKNSLAFDDFIAAHLPKFEVFLAASNIIKAVALEFEGILMTEFTPRFNERGPASNWASCEVGPDTKPHETTHFNSYPPLGKSVTVADHRVRNEAAGLNRNAIKSILHWDQLEPNIITIEPPSITIHADRTGV
ncbi:hypothetical protein [Bradyrhizobium jicamae]|uniref:hypothetical protein n=1 Tax=Bradyrhizobium jicamae TaxID=280332 RepID=UPI001BAB33CB|nr:hypothetical protein [Bradyrhizobium jicamae]MBR0939423.1 hypothetical protein [Bradyrhizobium jicamae]